MEDFNDEIWKPIKGYEGLYEVSNKGRVANLNYHGKKGKRVVMKQNRKPGYITAGLRDRDGKVRTLPVHRLVGIAFLPPPTKERTQINHINGDKQDNRVENLEWCTAKENHNNPATIENNKRRYHREGEFERRSAGQKKRMREHPEDLQKAWDGWRRWWKNGGNRQLRA